MLQKNVLDMANVDNVLGFKKAIYVLYEAFLLKME